MSSGPQMVSANAPGVAEPGITTRPGQRRIATATGTSTSSTSATSMLNELSTPLKLASMPMSMLSKLFTAGSTATAAKAATTAANELGAAHAVGLTSGTGALGSTGLGGLGTGAHRQSPRVWVRPPRPAHCPCRPHGPVRCRRRWRPPERRCTSVALRPSRRPRQGRPVGHATDDAGGQHERPPGRRDTDPVRAPFDGDPLHTSGWIAAVSVRSAGWPRNQTRAEQQFICG